MRVAFLVFVWAPGGPKVHENWCVGPPVSPLGCPSLKECDVPWIGVFGGFVIVKLSWDFGQFHFFELEVHFGIQWFNLNSRFHLSCWFNLIWISRRLSSN